ncbi:MAG: diguanylate cyclase [Nitrospinae bacterium]|nr:diguanylate cyclase [Nitrospinota bacterium]
MISSNPLAHLIDLIGNVADAHTTALFCLTEDKLVMREHFTLSRNLDPNVTIKIGEGPIGLAAQNLEPQLIENIDSDIGGIYKKPEALKGFLAVPVIFKNLIGVLVIDTKESYQISIKLQKILSNFAEQIAWHLHQEKNETRVNDAPLPDLKELTSYCRFLAESPNRSSVADRLTQIPDSMIAFKSIAVIWFEENQKEGRIIGHRGFTHDLSETVVHFGKGLVGSCAKNRSPLLLHFNSERKTILFSEGEKPEGLLSAVALPIQLNENFFGVLLVGSELSEGLGNADLDKLSLIVSAAGSALFCADTKDRWVYDKNLDPVTGVPNHRFLTEYQLAVSEELFKSDQPVYFWSVQITNLTNLYQTHGVDQGDAFLKQMIALFAKMIPSPKFVFRYSENTFVLMLMNRTQKEVKQLEARLKQLFEYNPLHVNGTAMQASMQWGISVYPDDAKELFGLISLSRNRLSPKIKEMA